MLALTSKGYNVGIILHFVLPPVKTTLGKKKASGALRVRYIQILRLIVSTYRLEPSGICLAFDVSHR